MFDPYAEQAFDEVEFQCKAKTEIASEDASSKLEDEVKFKVSLKDSNQLHVEVKYEQETETNVTEIETESKYKVRFERLVEYQKSVNSTLPEAYDFEQDVIVKETPLVMSGMLSEVVWLNNDTYLFSISSLDGVATFTFHIFTGASGDSNSTDVMTANKMKIDLELVDYPWESNDTDIALISTIETTQTIEVEYEEEDASSDSEGDDDDDNEGDTDDGADEETSEETTATEVPDEEGDDDNDNQEGAERKLEGEEEGTKKTKDVKISFADAVNLTGVRVFGEYTWATDALVNMVSNETMDDEVLANHNETQPIQVVATSPATPTTSSTTNGAGTVVAVAFSFVNSNGAKDIYWDPEVGVGYGDEQATDDSSTNDTNADNTDGNNGNTDSNTDNNNDDNDDDKSSISAGAIAGIVMLALVLVIAFLACRSKGKKEDLGEPKQDRNAAGNSDEETTSSPV